MAPDKREMALISRSINIPLVLEIGEGLIDRLPAVLLSHSLFFQKTLILYDEVTYKVAGGRVCRELASGSQIFESLVEGNTLNSLSSVREEIRCHLPDVVVGVGGGTVLDVGKYAAFLENVNFLSIPTVTSNDGISSPVAVINSEGKSMSLGAKMPLGVIADLGVIKDAPLRMIRAGVGDLISNLSAIEDWRLAYQEGKDRFDNFAALLAEAGAEAVLNFAKPDLGDLNFLSRLINGLVLSGVSMGIAGSSRPCSGGEHEISHSLDRVASKPALHGEQVALGTILTTYFRGGDFASLKDFLAALGLPLTAEELCLSSQELVKAIVQAPQTRPERYTILEKIGVDENKAKEALVVTGICKRF